LPVFVFFSFTHACSSKRVLGLSAGDAAARLESGNIQFIVDASVHDLPEITRLGPSAPFYAALQLQADAAAPLLRGKLIVLYNEAMRSKVTRIAALEKLMELDGEATFKKYRWNPEYFGEGPWCTAFKLYSEFEVLKDSAKKAPPGIEFSRFFLNGPLENAHKWLYSMLKNELFDIKAVHYAEEWAFTQEFIGGRFSVTRSSYGEALAAFNRALKKRGAERAVFEYAGLLNDLGKSYQYAAPRDGIARFNEWEAELPRGDRNNRYRLLFYLARMSRQIRRYDDAHSYFVRAIPLAPDDEQRDASIWYMIDTAYQQKEEKIIPLLKEYSSQWTDPGYFTDILDKFGVWAAKKHRWELFRDVYYAIKDTADAETRSKFAYIYGRALEYGLVSKKKEAESAAAFFKIAYNGNNPDKYSLPPFYYRELAAGRLNWPLNIESLLIEAEAPVSSPPPAPAQLYGAVPVRSISVPSYAAEAGEEPEKLSEEPPPEPSPEELAVEFLDGFFRYGCAAQIGPYLKSLRPALTTEQLRLIAEKLSEAREWQQAVSLVIYYLKRPDARLTRHDLELAYPLGHKELIESYAEKAGVDKALLFALVRRESVFNAAARSWAGAQGLTQLMRGTGNEMARILARNGGADYTSDGEVDLLNPEINVHLGSLYLRQLFDITKNKTLAVLSYNGGIGRLRRFRRAESSLSDDLFLETVDLTETRNYGRAVLGDQAIYQFLYYN
jgi:soluble lytic murein transglycosylase